MKIHVVVTPLLIDKKELHGSLCVAIDVLRCTSSIVTALCSGAHGVFPCLSIEEAREKAVTIGVGKALLGGEDKGQHIPGFDLGNSPLEYMDSDKVSGKFLVTYTSNGTGTIRKTYDASQRDVYIASLINMSAVTKTLMIELANGKSPGIVFLCSGRYGHPSAEDLFCAGLLVQEVVDCIKGSAEKIELTDSAVIAAGFASGRQEDALRILSTSDHGRFLESIGFRQDLEFLSRIDIYGAVPVFNGELVILSS